MRVNWKIVSGLLATGWAYDTYVALVNKKRLERIKLQRDAFEELARLYADALIKNEIPMDSFTEIIMEDIRSTLS